MEIIDRIFQLMNNKNLTANALEVKAKLSN